MSRIEDTSYGLYTGAKMARWKDLCVCLLSCVRACVRACIGEARFLILVDLNIATLIYLCGFANHFVLRLLAYCLSPVLYQFHSVPLTLKPFHL